MNFEDIWREIYLEDGGIVQEYNELEHICNLAKECSSYLEIGTAEGKSLYAIAKSNPSIDITYIDFGEPHTTPIRNKNIAKITNNVDEVLGDSNTYASYELVKNGKYDMVMIDAGHTLFNVLIDALWYGPLAKKYIVFHDVMIGDVRAVFDWYVKNMPIKESYFVINSQTYGYGVIKL